MLPTDEACLSFWCSYLTEKGIVVYSVWQECDTHPPQAPNMTVGGNITMFVSLTKTWINWCLWVYPMHFLFFFFSPVLLCTFPLTKARGRENFTDLRGDHWERREWWSQRHALAHLCAQGESANDLWHMDNFSYGTDHFLIRIVPLKAAILDGFQPLAEMSRVNDGHVQKKKSPRQEANIELHKVIDLVFYWQINVNYSKV